MSRQVTHHPIAIKIGLGANLTPETDLLFYANRERESDYEFARISVTADRCFEFSLRDVNRNIGARFNADGVALALNCSTGLPSGETALLVEQFCEEVRYVLRDLVMRH